jgi:hypothetical protein
MKIILVLSTVVLGFALGLQTGARLEHEKQASKIHSLQSRLERFEDRAVFDHAKEVAKITGADFYQVLTGRK